MNKQLTWEILAIVLLSGFVGVASNFILLKEPLPFVRPPKVEIVASDADLFGSSTLPSSATVSHSSASVSTSVPVGNLHQTAPAVQNTSTQSATKQETSKSSQPSSATVPQSASKPLQASTSQPQANGSEVVSGQIVTFEQVKKLLGRSDVIFIDARQKPEYDLGHLQNALNIYAPDFEKNIMTVLPLNREHIVICYCGGGACELSHELAENMRNLGFKRVYVYTGGWTEWKEKTKN